MEPEFTIANDYDPDGDMSTNADPMAESLTYLFHVRGAAVGDMGFTLDDFKRYIAGLRKNPKGKIAASRNTRCNRILERCFQSSSRISCSLEDELEKLGSGSPIPVQLALGLSIGNPIPQSRDRCFLG